MIGIASAFLVPLLASAVSDCACNVNVTNTARRTHAVMTVGVDTVMGIGIALQRWTAFAVIASQRNSENATVASTALA